MITRYKDFNNILKNYNNTTFKYNRLNKKELITKVDIGRRINKNNFYRALQTDEQLLVSVKTEDNNKLDIIKIQTI